MPKMPPDEYQELKADIAKNGQAEPIVVDGDVLIDGSNRLRACKELGIEPRILEWRDTEYGREHSSDPEAIAHFICPVRPSAREIP
jgi:hypothetical protein